MISRLPGSINTQTNPEAIHTSAESHKLIEIEQAIRSPIRHARYAHHLKIVETY
jgi:hypothetical protein